ncbi:MAG: hypothetical protein AAFP90_23155, partial [Planctomycetota bacterium]
MRLPVFPICIAILTLVLSSTTIRAEERTHSFVAFGSKTFRTDESGKKVWTYPHSTRDGFQQTDGTMVLTLSKGKRYPGGAVVLVSPDGKESLIWKGTQSEINSTHPTPDGTFVITEAGPKPRLLEIDGAGKVLVE